MSSKAKRLKKYNAKKRTCNRSTSLELIVQSCLIYRNCLTRKTILSKLQVTALQINLIDFNKSLRIYVEIEHNFFKNIKFKIYILLSTQEAQAA